MALSAEMVRIEIHGNHLKSTINNIVEGKRAKVVLDNAVFASAMFVLSGGQFVSSTLSYPLNIYKFGVAKATKSYIHSINFAAKHMNYVAFLLLVTPLVFINRDKYMANQIAMFMNIATANLKSDPWGGKIPFKGKSLTVDELEQRLKQKHIENRKKKEQE